jgi:putative transposase
MMINPGHKRLSIVRQCELVSISRASFYRQPAGESEENLELMRLIDETFLECPFYGARQMARHLRRLERLLGRRRQRRRPWRPGCRGAHWQPRRRRCRLASQNGALCGAAHLLIKPAVRGALSGE